MRFENVAIPLGHAWSSPFVRWQGSLSTLSSLDLAVDVTTRAIAERSLPASELDEVVLGWTIPQEHAFYGAPTLAARIGAPGVSGPMIAQACATGVAAVQSAAASVAAGGDRLSLVVCSDRTSNGPHLVYPAPHAQGGRLAAQDWVLDSFAHDPWTETSQLEAAENVAAEQRIERRELDLVTVMRYEQYQTSIARDRAFQRRYMVAAHVSGRRTSTVVEADEGIHPTSAEGLGALPPARPGGVLTYGTQTHPADGCAGAIVTSVARARSLSRDGVARILSVGHARVDKAQMPKAPVPAAERALADAGLTIEEVDAICTHNPFPINDVYLARETGASLERMNARGSSLIYGHPQAPTGLRAMAELLETLRERGGGVGLFTGCAAGDTGAALVVQIDD